MIRLQHRIAISVRAGIVALALGGAIAASPGIAHADATEEYPIPNRILTTSCTAEQIMAAARDVAPIYYERYMIAYNTRHPMFSRRFRIGSTGSSLWTTPDAANTPRTPPPTPSTSNWRGTGPSCSSTTRALPRTPPISARATHRTTCRSGIGDTAHRPDLANGGAVPG